MLAEVVSYYDQLIREHPDEVAPIGWCSARVEYILQIDVSGRLKAIVPLQDKHSLMRIVPQQVKKSSGVAANFLCDRSPYLLGLDLNGKPDRTAKCFQAAKDLHHEVLDAVETDCARAILRFFDTWEPSVDAFVKAGGDNAVLSGKNLTFSVTVDNKILDPTEDNEIRRSWEECKSSESESELMRCLVTGEFAPVARLHPSIKGVYGAQTSGASLVSFNAPAFESYGHVKEQGRNAPVSERAAQSYALALNYLLSNPNHHTRLGDTTIVYWSDHKDEENAQAFGAAMGFGLLGEIGTGDVDTYVDHTVKAVVRGDYRALDGVDPEATFYILGIAPSAARLVVKFYLQDSFGSMLDNLRKHYERSDVSHPTWERAYLSPYQLLREIENPEAKKPKAMQILAAPLIESMLQGAPYPQSLYANALIRIHATQEDTDAHVRKVSRGRAAILRAYLTRNCTKKGYDEGSLTVELNQERDTTAYNLGRAFSIFEQIQQRANGEVTLTNRYYNAASTTPAAVFPTVIRLSKAHLAKIERESPRLAYWFRRQLEETLGEGRVCAFPKRLSLEEQGDFALGNYHQASKRFSGKRYGDDIADTDKKE